MIGPVSKLPRIDLAKARAGGAAGRREAVDRTGDSLRELGGVRLQLAPGENDAEAIADEVIALVAEYFGLAPAALAPPDTLLAAELRSLADPGALPAAALLAVVTAPERAADLRLGAAAGAVPVAARAGEWLAIAGPALATLTAGVVPAGRWQTAGGAPLHARLLVLSQAPLGPLPEFRRR